MADSFSQINQVRNHFEYDVNSNITKIYTAERIFNEGSFCTVDNFTYDVDGNVVNIYETQGELWQEVWNV